MNALTASSHSSLFDFQRRGAVTTVRACDGVTLNASDSATADELMSVLRDVTNDPENRVIVISGGDTKCSLPVNLEFVQGSIRDRAPRLAELCSASCKIVEFLAGVPIPVVVSVRGFVSGMMSDIALAADLAVGGDDLSLRLGWAAVGASPMGGVTWWLPKLVGLRKATELLMRDESVLAKEALAIGLLNQVSPVDRLTSDVEAISASLAAGPVFAYGKIKELLRASPWRSLPDQLDRERTALLQCCATKEFAQSIER